MDHPVDLFASSKVIIFKNTVPGIEAPNELMGKKDEEGAVASCYYGHSMRKQGSCLERDNARNNVRCTQARKTTHGLDRRVQEKTPRKRVDQNDRGQI